MKWIGLQRYGHSRILGTYGTPILGEGEVVGGQRWHIRKSDGSFYRLSIVTVALSATIRPQFAIECLRRSNQRGVGDFGPKFRSVPLGAEPSCWAAKSERPRLTNDEIIFEEFQPMWSQFTNVTDKRTDRQTTCDRNTALCTKVHRAVKNVQLCFEECGHYGIPLFPYLYQFPDKKPSCRGDSRRVLGTSALGSGVT